MRDLDWENPEIFYPDEDRDYDRRFDMGEPMTEDFYPEWDGCNHWPGQKNCGWCDLGNEKHFDLPFIEADFHHIELSTFQAIRRAVNSASDFAPDYDPDDIPF